MPSPSTDSRLREDGPIAQPCRAGARTCRYHWLAKPIDSLTAGNSTGLDSFATLKDKPHVAMEARPGPFLGMLHVPKPMADVGWRMSDVPGAMSEAVHHGTTATVANCRKCSSKENACLIPRRSITTRLVQSVKLQRLSW